MLRRTKSKRRMSPSQVAALFGDVIDTDALAPEDVDILSTTADEYAIVPEVVELSDLGAGAEEPTSTLPTLVSPPARTESGRLAQANHAGLMSMIVNNVPGLRAGTIEFPYVGVENGKIQDSPFSLNFRASGLNIKTIAETVVMFAEESFMKTETIAAAQATTITVGWADLQAAQLGPHANFMVEVGIAGNALQNIAGNDIAVSAAGQNSRGQAVDFGTWIIRTDDVTKPLSLKLLPFRMISSRPQPTDLLINPIQSFSVTIGQLPLGTIVNVTLPGVTHRAAMDMLRLLNVSY